MDKYIDVEALKEKLMCAGMLISDIDNLPTADVAPVVRCQGCELCKPQDIKNTYDNRTERGLFCHYWQQKVYPDDFCSYGERKAVE